jgi:transcriptional regulator with XRE-family HTH domain
MRIGCLLRRARESRELSQEDLAELSGISQSVISAYERERKQPGWVAAERLFAAMGLQMRIELEPLDADLDRQIDAYAAMTAEERLRALPYVLKALDSHLEGIPLVVTGAAAAALHGVPVPVRRVDLLLPDTDAAVDAFCAQLPLVEELPQAVTVVVDGTNIPALPLHEIELADPEAARLLARVRDRRQAIS